VVKEKILSLQNIIKFITCPNSPQ